MESSKWFYKLNKKKTMKHNEKEGEITTNGLNKIL